MTKKLTTSYLLLATKLIRRIRLRTWVALGLIVILTPLAFAAVYGVWGALGGSNATPVAVWHFDEGVDNTCSGGANDACDSSGSANDGAFGATTAAPTWQTEDKCVSGKCMLFDGSDDTITVANTVAGVQTVSFFVKAMSTSTTQEILDLNATDYFTSVSGTVTVNGFGTDTIYVDGVSGATTLTANRWHHVTITSTTGFSASAIKMGQVSTNFGNLFLDEVKLFTSTLSAAQVKAEFAGGAAVLGSQDTDFLNQGLVGYWNTDESTATTANDASGNGNHTTDSNTSVAGGKFGNARSFNGSTSYIARTSSLNSIPNTHASQTMSGWIYSTGSGSRDILATNNGGNTGNQFRVNGSNNIDVGRWGGGNNITSSATISNDAWYHVAWTWDGTTNRLYINGSLDNTSTTIPQTGTTSEVIIGAYDNGSSFENYSGSLDEIRLYNRALSPSEVKALYNWAPGPVGYWPMDENTGVTAFDKSGNGLNGTLTGSFTNSGWTQGKFGSGINFDSNGEYITFTDNAVFDLYGTKQYTWNFWVKPQAFTEWSTLWSQTFDASDYITIYMHTTADTTFGPVTAGVAVGYQDGSEATYRHTTNSVLSTNTWAHVTVTFDSTQAIASQLNIFVNGVNVTDTSDSHTNGTAPIGDNIPTANIRVGNGEPFPTEDLDAVVDEVKFYNYARNSQQIVEDMNAGHPTGGSPIGSQLHYWKFDEMNADVAHDTIATANADLGGGTSCPQSGDSSCPTWTSGKFSGALDFDTAATTDDYVSVASPNLPTGDFTYTMWVNLDTAANTLLMSSDGAGGNEFLLTVDSTDSNRLKLFLNAGAADAASTQSISTGVWTHLAATRSGSTVTLYINGSVDGTGSDSTTLGFSTCELLIGVDADTACAGSLGEYIDGTVDETKIYTSALTPEQIKIDLNQGASINFGGGVDGSTDTITGSITPPVGYWKFDEKTDNTCSGGANDLCDLSGNTNDALKTNMSSSNWTRGKFGSGMDFDGNNDYLTVTDSGTSSLDLGTTGSISLWVKSDRAWPSDDTTENYRGFVNKANSGGTPSLNSYSFHWNGTNSTSLLRLLRSNGSVHEPDTYNIGALTVGQWYHFAVAWNASNVYWYVNGSLVEVDTHSISAQDTDASVYIGGNAFNGGTSTFMWDGQLDEVKVFNYLLTPDQVAYEYNHGDPLAWFKFDECTGTTLNDSGDGTVTNLTLNIGASGTNSDISGGDCSSGDTAEAWNNGTAGKFGSAIDFDGTDDYAIYAGQIVDNPLTTVSFSAWINPDNISSTQIILEQISGAIQINRALSQWSVVVGNVSNEIVTTTGGTATAGSWSHVTGVYDGSNVKLYINGKFITQTAQTGALRNISNHFVLGCDGDISNTCITYFAGQADDVRIYGYALSDDQVKRAFNEGKAVRF